MTRLLAAVAFLTRVPVRRPFDGADVGRSTLFFPAVGAALGLAQLGLFLGLGRRLPPLVTATLVVAFSAWSTRAMHLDGLADFADGLGGGFQRERALEVMRDPRVGAFGATALVLVLVVKVAAIAALAAPLALVLAPTLARWASVPLGFFLPYARKEGAGLGAALTDHVGLVELFGASACVALVALLTSVELAAPCLLAALAVTALTGLVARRRLAGVTGDVLGANVELAEAAALVAAVAWRAS